MQEEIVNILSSLLPAQNGFLNDAIKEFNASMQLTKIEEIKPVYLQLLFFQVMFLYYFMLDLIL